VPAGGIGEAAGGRVPTIRDALLRAQLRPVPALAVAAATVIGLPIAAQYAWPRLHVTNPLDEIPADEIRQVLRAGTPEQLPVLTRWIAALGLGMTVETRAGVPPGQARLPDGRQVARPASCASWSAVCAWTPRTADRSAPRHRRGNPRSGHCRMTVRCACRRRPTAAPRPRRPGPPS